MGARHRMCRVCARRKGRVGVRRRMRREGCVGVGVVLVAGRCGGFVWTSGILPLTRAIGVVLAVTSSVLALLIERR